MGSEVALSWPLDCSDGFRRACAPGLVSKAEGLSPRASGQEALNWGSEAWLVALSI